MFLSPRPSSFVVGVDWLLDPTHDLSNPERQSSLAAQLKEASFIAAALDCSTKSRAREIPREFSDGRPAPKPLRSPRFPEGLPELTGRDKERVERDNVACTFVLEQIQLHTDRGGASVRENPWNSLHCSQPRRYPCGSLANGLLCTQPPHVTGRLSCHSPPMAPAPEGDGGDCASREAMR